jgi:hypothetical protein
MIILTLLLVLLTEIYFKPRFQYLDEPKLFLIFYSAKSKEGAKTRKRLIIKL